jgi:predicted AlkP superfamily phosphohydrolase/phosphomutase
MSPVVAIGIDAGDPILIERLSQEGHLPTLSRLRRSGAYGRLENLHVYRAETAWTTFLTGVRPDRTAFWSPLKYLDDYQADNVGAYDFSAFLPFYALVPDARVAVFDLPQTRIVPGVNGIQVTGWGAHSPMAPSQSAPATLLEDLVARHGSHPTLESDEASIYDRAALLDLRDRLLEGLRRRAAITKDLLRRERWDLFLTMISETHSAGHNLWHLSQPGHPLYASAHRDGEDPLGDIMRSVDGTIADIIGAAARDATIVIFSVHGMEANTVDLPSMVFLPELMFRYSFPGRRGLTGAADGAAIPPPQSRLRRSCWEDELYAMKHDGNPVTRLLRRHVPSDLYYRVERKLGWRSAPVCYRECSKLHYQPAWWYRDAWPQMKAFALPSFSEGYVRINLAGREPNGIVGSGDYDRVCAEITSILRELLDARSGRPLVRHVTRTRQSPDENEPTLPDADLIVSWQPVTTDVVDSPALGRIGPVPFLRSGSHVERGFIMLSGPGIPAGSTIAPGHALDLAPTVLSLMGVPVPSGFDGTPLELPAPTAV